MTLGYVVCALRGRWAVVLLVSMLVFAGSIGLAAVMPNTYVATAIIGLRWSGAGSDVAEVANVRYLTREARSIALLIETPSVIEDALRRAGLDLSPSEFGKRLVATAPRNTQLVQVSASGDDPQEAADLATATAKAVVAAVKAGPAMLEQVPADVGAFIAIEARPPSAPSSPLMRLHVAAGLFAGPVLGAGVALLLTRVRDRNKTWAPIPSDVDESPPVKDLRVAHCAWALLIAASIPWRSHSFYEGGADPVVLAKAGLSVIALALSIAVFSTAPRRHPISATPVMIVVAYLGVTMIGGLANGDLVAASVVAVRVAILATSVCLLATAIGPRQLMRSLVHVLTVIVVCGAATGLLSLSGRLHGGFPPLHPNLLASLAAIVVLWLWAKVYSGTDSNWDMAGILICVLVVYLTGSRTGLASLVVAAVAMTVRLTAIRLRTITAVSLLLPVMTYLALGTDLLESVLERGGEQNITTLSNRTIAWQAALGMERDGWQTWFGQGLAQKKIDVPGQWWDTQMLDSTWVSALVQGGLLGLALVALLVVATLTKALFAPRAEGALWFGLALYLVLDATLESGLFDGSAQFMVFLVTSLGAFGSRLVHQAPST